MNSIEQQLKRKVQQPTLSDAGKDRLFVRVIQKEGTMHTPSLTERLRSIFAVSSLSMAACGVLVFAVWSVLRMNNNVDTHIVQQDVNVNASTTENANILPTVEVTHTFAKSIDSYIFGMGGAILGHRWSLSSDDVLSTDVPSTIQERELVAWTDMNVDEIGNIFNIDISAIRRIEKTSGEIIFTTLPRSSQSSLCFEMRALQSWTNPCVFVSNRGVVNFEQKESDADVDGLAEAWTYITALTGHGETEWHKAEISAESGISEIMPWTQYYIWPKEDSTFSGSAWHVSLSSGRLVSFFGSLASTQLTEKTVDVVSPQEAFERLQKDFMVTTTAESYEPRWVIGQYTNPFGDLTLSKRQGVDVVITDIELSYGIFSSLLQPGTYLVLPVYSVRGVEKNTDKLFAVTVDASVNGRAKLRDMRLVSHPAQLVGM